MLLAHRGLAPEVLRQALDRSIETGCIDPQLVLIDARRLARTDSTPAVPIGVLTRYDRPVPSLTAYDTLLTGLTWSPPTPQPRPRSAWLPANYICRPSEPKRSGSPKSLPANNNHIWHFSPKYSPPRSTTAPNDAGRVDLGGAKFPRIKRLAGFDVDAVPGISAGTLGPLAAGGYLDAGEPVVLLGDSGTGKSHLLIGLGLAACEQGRRVR